LIQVGVSNQGKMSFALFLDPVTAVCALFALIKGDLGMSADSWYAVLNNC